MKILDFGVAKILASPDGEQSVKTRTGSLMGTPLYMSPEQCKGAGLLDHRTDIYSLGVILFEMISGRPPFTAEGVGELFAKHMLEDAPLVTEFAPNAPPHMAAAIMKSLAKEPDARFANMEDFRKAIVGEIKVAMAVSSGKKIRFSNTQVATMSPRASTTLSSASSEIDESFDLAPRRRRMMFGLLGGGALAAALAYFFVFKDQTPAEVPKPVVATTTTPPPPVTPPTPPAPPVKKTVTIRFEADPPGAHVFRKKDNSDLGVVPVELQLAKDAAKAGPEGVTYVLRLPGYRERLLVADVATDRTIHVSLEKAPAPAPDKDKGHRAGGGHRPVKKNRNPVDEDGLATPSF